MIANFPVSATAAHPNYTSGSDKISTFKAPNWAIPADLLAANTRQVSDDPDTHDTSLTTALERKVSKSWIPQTRSTALAFYSESGEFFQLRYLEGFPDGRRYDAVAKSGLKYFYPTVPSNYRERINAELSVTLSLSSSFWNQVRHSPEVSIFDCEGPSKALSLVGIGYAAIAGFGAFGGVEKNEYKEFKRPIGKRKSGKTGGYTVEKVALPEARLSKGLSDLATKGRRITLVPDMDTNPKTAAQSRTHSYTERGYSKNAASPSESPSGIQP
jgi:Domain of unknown function (DUF3854)